MTLFWIQEVSIIFLQTAKWKFIKLLLSLGWIYNVKLETRIQSDTGLANCHRSIRDIFCMLISPNLLFGLMSMILETLLLTPPTSRTSHLVTDKWKAVLEEWQNRIFLTHFLDKAQRNIIRSKQHRSSFSSSSIESWEVNTAHSSIHCRSLRSSANGYMSEEFLSLSLPEGQENLTSKMYQRIGAAAKMRGWIKSDGLFFTFLIMACFIQQGGKKQYSLTHHCHYGILVVRLLSLKEFWDKW